MSYLTNFCDVRSLNEAISKRTPGKLPNNTWRNWGQVGHNISDEVQCTGKLRNWCVFGLRTVWVLAYWTKSAVKSWQSLYSWETEATSSKLNWIRRGTEIEGRNKGVNASSFGISSHWESNENVGRAISNISRVISLPGSTFTLFSARGIYRILPPQRVVSV